MEKLVWFRLIVLLAIAGLTQAVNLARYSKLKKEEFLELDREVSDFYNKPYDQLDLLNVTYDEQVLRSLRAQRHTVVINHYDFRYTNIDLMKKSEGPKVNEKQCQVQMGALVEMAKNIDKSPISFKNFLESNGGVEAGILNGNFVWLGSPATCKRAKISSNSTLEYFKNSQVGEIVGRYCIAHIKANSWPSWDKYFEERLRIRIGLCLPDTCHSRAFMENEQIRKDIDYITKYGLKAPFNSERYSTTYLYCLPDETSPYRQLDLGAKLLVAFLAFWLVVLLYTNVKYHQRKKTMRKLRQSVDIRMIISQKRETDDDNDDELSGGENGEKKSYNLRKESANQTGQQLSPTGATLKPYDDGNTSHVSSVAPTPVASEIEDNDGDFKGIRPIISQQQQRKKTHKRKHQAEKQVSSEKGIDFLRAFSIESNLDYLFKRRTSEIEARQRHANQPTNIQQQIEIKSKRLSLVKRTSASNEALIKDLKKVEEQGERKSKVAIVSGDNSSKKHYKEQDEVSLLHSSDDEDPQSSRHKRVNMDIFDGVKVLATFYIVHGHTLMFFFGIVTDIRFGTERMFDFTMITCFNTLHVVSLFYIITGTLLTYLAFSRQKTKQLLKPTFWLLVILGRYLRLIPAYLLIFWFARHLSPYTGWGPTWFDYRTDDEHVRGYCANESWLTMLTMSSADIKIPFGCVPQAWYLSNDFRTLLILPFYIMILAKSITLGYVAIFASIMVSWARLTYILREANIDYKVLMTWHPHVYSILADRLHDVYTDLLTRLSTYLLGVLVGHILFLYETRQIKQWPDWLKNYGLKLALMVGFAFFMGAPLLANPYINQFLPNVDDIDSDTAAIFIPLFRAAMEFCICLVLLILVTGGGYGWLNDFLSSNICKVLANISYCVFLVHVEVMYKVKVQKIESTYWSLFCHSTFFIVFSSGISFSIYLLYEMPINNLLRYVFRKLLKFVTR